MNHLETIRAWKDPDYREGLGSEDRTGLEHPAGSIELDESQLDRISGGQLNRSLETYCSDGYRCYPTGTCWP